MPNYHPDHPTITREIGRVDDDFGDVDVAKVTINGYEYSMNVDYVPEDKRQWFIDVFGDILTRVDERARHEVRADRTSRLRSLCGLE